MLSNVFPLSSLNTSQLSSSLQGVEFKQYKRTHNGGIPFIFAECFSNVCDYKSKYYTDFVLTQNTKSSDIFNFEFPKIDIPKFLTTIRDSDLYLTCVDIDIRYLKDPSAHENQKYRGALFMKTGTSPLTTFTLDFFRQGECKIKCEVDSITYCLIYDPTQTNEIYFVNERSLPFDDSIVQPHHFKFIYQENHGYITFFKDTPQGLRYIYRSVDRLKSELIAGFNKLNVIESVFSITRNKYFNFKLSLNSTFITYTNEDNKVDVSKSDFELKNNFLIHKKNSIKNSKNDITVLKNHFLPHIDQISNANSLLIPDKTQPSEIVVDNIRNYTSIFEDIQTEKDDDLALNYVYHNKFYKIVPGKNEFIAPSDMFPFSQININDTKIRQAGAFSYPIPEFADKIYYFDNDVQINNNQHYLCTWLSGAAGADDAVWVDRYYYPDRINKRDALNGKSIFGKTYDQYIESYIRSNSLGLYVDEFKFFDKLSDLVFKPNRKYIYDRISFSPKIEESITYCNTFISNENTNYFKKINESGEFTFILYFYGNDNEWYVQSNRNQIDAGVKITKNKDNVIISYVLYETNLDNEPRFSQYSKTVKFKKFSENIIYIGFNSYTGHGYLMFNEEPLIIIKESAAKFAIRNILFGDFYIYERDMTRTNSVVYNSTNLLNYNGINISDKFISDKFYTRDIVNSITISKGKYNTNPIYITLPCGMRNGTDNIDLLHTICGNTSSKSSKSNIFIKNLKIENENILKNLKSELETQIKNIIPASSDVNIDITQNYK